MGRHRPARAGADRARRDRRADDLDDQSGDGRRARAARDRARRAGRLSLRGPDLPAGLGLRIGRGRDDARPGSSAAWRPSPSARSAPPSEPRSPRTSRLLGLSVAAVAFLLVGVGAGSAGTSVLALLASRVAPERRAAAASVVWMMMILGFAVSAPLAGHFLDPFSNARLIEVTSAVAAVAFAIAALAVWGVESSVPADVAAPRQRPRSVVVPRRARRDLGRGPRFAGSRSSSSSRCSPTARRSS